LQVKSRLYYLTVFRERCPVWFFRTENYLLCPKTIENEGGQLLQKPHVGSGGRRSALPSSACDSEIKIELQASVQAGEGLRNEGDGHAASRNIFEEPVAVYDDKISPGVAHAHMRGLVRSHTLQVTFDSHVISHNVFSLPINQDLVQIVWCDHFFCHVGKSKSHGCSVYFLL
jgi:hypothetical protein